MTPCPRTTCRDDIFRIFQAHFWTLMHRLFRSGNGIMGITMTCGYKWLLFARHSNSASSLFLSSHHELAYINFKPRISSVSSFEDTKPRCLEFWLFICLQARQLSSFSLPKIGAHASTNFLMVYANFLPKSCHGQDGNWSISLRKKVKQKSGVLVREMHKSWLDSSGLIYIAKENTLFFLSWKKFTSFAGFLLTVHYRLYYNRILYQLCEIPFLAS